MTAVPTLNDNNRDRDRSIVSDHQAGIAVATLSARWSIGHVRIRQIIGEAEKREKTGKPGAWSHVDLGPSPKDPFDRWPYGSADESDREIIRLYRAGLSVSQIRDQMKSYWGWVEQTIKMWRWRVIAISYERGLWSFDWTSNNHGRPIDMGGPRDIWIED